ncbi:MAG TPA: hypothetical protein VMJ75_01610 [Candidatus Acidoferrales bacterium]|nr:hypothetical protein [Candidatus Acidoferrales bacterium]
MNKVVCEWRTALRRLAGSLHAGHQDAEGDRSAERILALVPEGPNRRILEAASEDAGWALTWSNAEACGGVPAIVVYDRELSPQHWGEIVRAFAKESPRPYIILLSPTVDANLWTELERAGGSDIVRTPIRRDYLLWALIRAWQLWRTQQNVRTPAGAVTK